MRQAPSFYAIATTRPLDDILSETERLRYQIGMDQAVRRVGGHDTIEDTTPFTDALVRLRERTGSYQQLDDEVSLAEDTLFQTRIEMPANLVEGDYAAQFFLVRDREVISSGATTIRVEKTGIERWLYNLSRNRRCSTASLSVAARARRRLARRRGLPPRPALSRQPARLERQRRAGSRARSSTPSGAVGRASA